MLGLRVRRRDEHTRRARELTRQIERWEISPLEAGLRLSGLMAPGETYDTIAVGHADRPESWTSEIIIRAGDKITRRIPYLRSEDGL